MEYFPRMSCSYWGADIVGNSEFYPKCEMIKVEYQVFNKLRKYFDRSKDKKIIKTKEKISWIGIKWLSDFIGIVKNTNSGFCIFQIYS